MDSLASLGSSLVEAVGDMLDLALPTQHARLLRLHTPLGPEMLLAEALDGIEAIGPVDPDGSNGEAPHGFRLEILAVSTQTLRLQDLQAQPVLLELLAADSRTRLRPFHGHITEVRRLGGDGGLVRYRLIVEPWTSFLSHRQDAWVFQDKRVPEILEEVFADYTQATPLAAAWRFELADPAAYPKRSLCTQYQESDWAFVRRLMLEEGLFCWFEHSGDTASAALGCHTLVIADHNGAFQPNLQPRVRFTQSSAVLPDDTLTRWQAGAALQTRRVQLASWDHRALDTREVQAEAAGTPAGATGGTDLSHLQSFDDPAAYAWPDRAQGERLALRQMQALDAWPTRQRASGTLRRAAPGTTFELDGHPRIAGRFATLRVRHRARSNLHADAAAGLRTGQHGAVLAGVPTHAPLYTCDLLVQPLAVPVRAVALDAQGHPDPRLHRAPTVQGVHTALVVGLDEPVHTDRDHRVKVQFHWQRGAQSSHRLPHNAGTNAPADASAGTWVRVATPVAGANWGGHFVPRLGQEVVVAFDEGRIDRPVVVGAVYNGRGQPDAQANAVAGGAARATGNAPAWFPGTQQADDSGKKRGQGHAHTAVLAGLKSQELGTSQSGGGGYNQLVFDDTPGSGRVELATTQAHTRLQLGHLIHQSDNQRLQPRGHGADLATDACGALRAGAGQLLSAHARTGSTSATHQLDTREPQAALQQAMALGTSLTQAAQQHQASLAGEPQAKALPVHAQQGETLQSLKGSQRLGDAPEGDKGDESEVGGGRGTIPTLARPDLVLAAPGGIALSTPANSILSAGQTVSLTAGQDTSHTATRHLALAARSGIAWFTYGKADAASRAVTHTGIALHAASGTVSSQSQAAATRVAAQQRVDVTSTQASVKASAPQHVQLAAAGSALRLEGGNITLTTPGKAVFRAAMKELTGGASASASSLDFAQPAKLDTGHHLQFEATDLNGQALANKPYVLIMPDGSVKTGKTDASGKTMKITTDKREQVQVFIEDAEHQGFRVL